MGMDGSDSSNKVTPGTDSIAGVCCAFGNILYPSPSLVHFLLSSKSDKQVETTATDDGAFCRCVPGCCFLPSPRLRNLCLCNLPPPPPPSSFWHHCCPHPSLLPCLTLLSVSNPSPAAGGSFDGMLVCVLPSLIRLSRETARLQFRSIPNLWRIKVPR